MIGMNNLPEIIEYLLEAGIWTLCTSGHAEMEPLTVEIKHYIKICIRSARRVKK